MNCVHLASYKYLTQLLNGNLIKIKKKIIRRHDAEHVRLYFFNFFFIIKKRDKHH